jgi:hypothetical protein
VAELTVACNSLAIASQFVPECREEFAFGLLDSVLRIVGACNRSAPHLAMLEAAVRALNVVAASAQVNDSLFNPPARDGELVTMLVDVVQMYRDKAAIFSGALTLIQAGWDNDRLQDDEEVSFRCAMTAPSIEKRMREIHKALAGRVKSKMSMLSLSASRGFGSSSIPSDDPLSTALRQLTALMSVLGIVVAEL